MEEQMYPGEEPMYWTLIAISIAFFLFIFFKYYLIPEWQQKKAGNPISHDVLDDTYKHDFETVKERIEGSENQHELNNVLYAIDRFRHSYEKVKNRILLELDVNTLICKWEKQERVLKSKKHFSLAK